MAEKKYRLTNEQYDEFDEMYATRLKQYSLPDSFHEFTEGLMSEKSISRFKLLDAIDDYKKAGLHRTNPLPDSFDNCAFNYRPHQGCIVC